MPELIFCCDGNRRFVPIALDEGFRYGAQLPNKVYYPPYFADQDFKHPRYTKYVDALKKYRPSLASVPDWMEARRFDEIMMRAEEIAQYAETIMIIPKVSGVDRIPDCISGKPVILGYSVPTSFGGTDLPLSDFGARPVHLLGGKPGAQIELAKRLNVVSIDCSYHQMKANYAEFWTGYEIRADGSIREKWTQLQDIGLGHLHDAPYHAFRMSCINIRETWEKVA